MDHVIKMLIEPCCRIACEELNYARDAIPVSPKLAVGDETYYDWKGMF